MHHDAGTLTVSDGLTLATRRWMPTDAPRGVVLLVHGLSEHSGRYAHVAAHLMLRGFAVLSYDHRHHGRSEGTPRALLTSFDRLVDDLIAVVRWARDEADGAPLFLMGHSLGGGLAARYVIDRGTDGFAGLVLSSPALKVHPKQSPLLRRIAPVLARFLPALSAPGLKRTDATRDPVMNRSFDEDPLTYKGGVRAATGNQILLATANLLDHTDAFTLPLYLFHGAEDRITDPEGTKTLYERAPSEDKTLRLFEGGLHETLNDLDRETVLQELSDWLEARS